ncbi:hypothetical protein OUZ56_012815 [Daphnia magna]|uniref:Uncharacterized protein n=1 Tax=Daphnia magna TaxID=35525 RepID=A0ABQ9Z449_9CRUS|nr:hypothetical protein OUZ56_012815 [Daphnia magna]
MAPRSRASARDSSAPALARDFFNRAALARRSPKNASALAFRSSSERGFNSADLDIKIFRNECGKFLVKMCWKIIERSPLRYSIVRAISCFDPEVLLSQPEIARKRNELLRKIFVKANRLTHSDSDKIESQFDKLVTLVGSKLKPDFEAFHPDPSRNIEQKRFRLDALYSFIFCPASFPAGYEEL